MNDITRKTRLSSTATGIIMEYNNSKYHLNSGTRDAVHIFEQSIGVYVLTINVALNYIGLDSYMPSETAPINSVFLHNQQDIQEALGADWEDMDPVEQAKVLLDHLC